jgi:hypothetical protein
MRKKVTIEKSVLWFLRNSETPEIPGKNEKILETTSHNYNN